MEINYSSDEVASDVLCEFLEVAVHTILYTRELYPPGIFSRRKKYNVPIQICYHPELSQYITDMISSLKPLLQQNAIDRVDMVILASSGDPLERFVFEMPHRKDDIMLSGPSSMIEFEQKMRAFLLKLSISDSMLERLPKDCSWCLQVHTKESFSYSMQEKQKIQDFTWVPADEMSLKMAAPKLMPLKSLDSGPVKMQLYVEESALKKQ